MQAVPTVFPNGVSLGILTTLAGRPTPSSTCLHEMGFLRRFVSYCCVWAFFGLVFEFCFVHLCLYVVLFLCLIYSGLLGNLKELLLINLIFCIIMRYKCLLLIRYY